MNIVFHKSFQKSFAKLSKKDKEKFKIKRNIFVLDEFNPVLNNHPLCGSFKGYRSINVGPDLRAVYKKIEEETVLFVEIGSHSKLYS